MTSPQLWIKSYKKRLFELQKADFEAFALEAFAFQAQNNPIYAQYLRQIRCDWQKINSLHNIPFLPIDFFKSFEIRSSPSLIQTVFESSGTTGQVRSRHFVSDLPFYQNLAKQIFENFYEKLENYEILALLPSYAERQTSSLVFMIDYFMRFAGSQSGFYLYDQAKLFEKLIFLQKENKKILLIGVTFALLDFAESYEISLKNAIIMETGGMKGRRKELLREEVHEILQKSFGVQAIHSEYGMTELLSQGYARSGGWFEMPVWASVLLREPSDPFSMSSKIRNGGINVIDLANIETCCFIETQDIGRLNADSSQFQVLGRFDQAEIRGCNLMMV